jgi:serine phosphatase RsbU (regulator of sigma subunit)
MKPEARYRLLLEMSQQVSRTLELREVLDHLLVSMRAVVPYDAAGVFVLSRRVPVARERDGFLIAGMSTVGFDEAPRDDDQMLREGKGIIGHVISSGRPYIAEDTTCDPYYVHGRPGTMSEVAVPIVSNGDVIGALNLESDTLRTYSSADVELLEFVAAFAAISIEKATLHKQVLEIQRIEHQLQLARHVQSSLLPAGPPRLGGFDIAGLNLPTMEVGGDYFDYVALDDGRLGLVVADVSGKGVPAALIMATFRAALRMELQQLRPIEDVGRRVNQVLVESIDTSRYVTAIYGALDPASGQFSYVNCGHNPPFVLRQRGEIEWLHQGRPALGLLFGDWPAEAGVVTLAPGDTLTMYTDGVTDPEDARERDYGVSRLASVLRSSAGLTAEQTVSAIVDATRAHSGRAGYEDDFTLMIVKRRLDSGASAGF